MVVVRDRVAAESPGAGLPRGPKLVTVAVDLAEG